ncbi:MAG: membrane integrity-associated transporter subunit PqiC [Zoogloeaceae bacterium]|nr:membrane integrity-associated transporter subunit PqiC [Zoogloeaceae bacterium]
MAMVVALAMAGCQSLETPSSRVRSYDLGAAESTVPMPNYLISTVTLSAPAWLRTTAMQYRMSDEDPRERRAYRDHRWVAPPGELIGARLQRDFAAEGRCRMELSLEEFVQDFSSPQESAGVMTVRASLGPDGDGSAQLHRRFAFRVPAGRPDAPAGVEALVRAVGQLSVEIRVWVDQPDARGLCQRS